MRICMNRYGNLDNLDLIKELNQLNDKYLTSNLPPFAYPACLTVNHPNLPFIAQVNICLSMNRYGNLDNLDLIKELNQLNDKYLIYAYQELFLFLLVLDLLVLSVLLE